MAFGQLQSVWICSQLSERTKIDKYNVLVCPNAPGNETITQKLVQLPR